MREERGRTGAEESGGGLASWLASVANDPDAGLARLVGQARRLKLPAGASVFRRGSPCQNYLVVLEGAVRVQITAESGREVVLYRVAPGQSCVVTTSCLLAGQPYPAEAVSETPVEALALSLPVFRELMDRSAPFRAQVFENLGRRLADVIQRMEAVSFGDLDRRLAGALLERSGGGPRAAVTHEALARELGTAREVVSRHLKRMERRGWVRLRRAEIELASRTALENLARDV